MARYSKSLGNSYASALACYEGLEPATNRQKTVPGSRRMRGEATHRRVRLNANDGNVECWHKSVLLATYHPDNSVTVYHGDMTQTDAQHHNRVLPEIIRSDVGFSGGPVVLLWWPELGGNIWRHGRAYLVPRQGLRVTLGEHRAIHPDSARQPFVTYAVDRKKAAAKRKEHGVDDFIAWATMTNALNPGLLAGTRWASIPTTRQGRASEILEIMADQTRWLDFCEHYKHNAISAARLAVIDRYECWTQTEVPYLDGGWTGVKSWRGQCLEFAYSSRRKD